jgi:hypothetical protein
MLHWTYITECLAKINARRLVGPGYLLVCVCVCVCVCVDAAVLLTRVIYTFFPHKRKYSRFIYSDGRTDVYPSFLRTDGRRKSRRLSTKISIVMQKNFFHYENLFLSLWKNISFTMEIFVHPCEVFLLLYMFNI